MAALDCRKVTPIYADARAYSRGLDPMQMIAAGSRQARAGAPITPASIDGTMTTKAPVFSGPPPRPFSLVI